MASRTTRTTVLLTAAVAVPVLVGGAGAAYAAHYQDRALPGSTLGGVSVAGMSRQEVADLVARRAADVTVTLDTGGAHRTAHLDDLGYTVDVDATVGAVFAANESWSSYATSLVSSREVQAVPKTDPAATAAVVSELVRTVGKAGKDARVELAPSKKSFVVVPAVSGHTVSRATFHDVVSAAARDLSSTTTTLTFVDAVPTVTTHEAEAVAARANALVATPVRVDDGDEEHAASKARKASWISIPTVDGELGSPTVKAAKVKAWVDSVVEDANSEPRAGVRNVSSTGAVRAVVTEARDGARVTNGGAVAEAATKALGAGKAYTGRFTYTKIPATWTSRQVAAGAEHLAYPAARGERWIDVNLSKHTMTAYIGAQRVHGPVRMVNGSAEKPTVVGTFHVYLKYSSQTMRGSNADGSRYETPDVPWISYFHRGFALHGAPWRSSFGYSGSHGCINLPVGVAKWVYDFAPVGTPVTTHF